MIFLGEILCHNHSAKEVEIPAEFEWTATMLNINSNRNRELMERCKYLQDYSTYVRLVEENKRKYAYMREAVLQARRNEPWRKEFVHARELRERGRKEGYEEGYEEGLAVAQAQLEKERERIAELEARIAELERRQK